MYYTDILRQQPMAFIISRMFAMMFSGLISLISYGLGSTSCINVFEFLSESAYKAHNLLDSLANNRQFAQLNMHTNDVVEFQDIKSMIHANDCERDISIPDLILKRGAS